MRQISLPNWLLWVDKNLSWLSIPKLPLLLTVIQALGFVLIKGKPEFLLKLTLVPGAVLQGEVWRIFTFIVAPFAGNFLLVLVVLWFLYYVMVNLEKIWGTTLLTVYFLIAWFCSVLAALLIGTTIETFVYMEVSFFFALATLTPNNIIHLFFILPIAYKWIAVFIALVLLVVPLFLGDISQQLYIFLLFTNYLIFFGKDYWLRFKRELDKRKKAQ